MEPVSKYTNNFTQGHKANQRGLRVKFERAHKSSLAAIVYFHTRLSSNSVIFLVIVTDVPGFNYEV